MTSEARLLQMRYARMKYRNSEKGRIAIREQNRKRKKGLKQRLTHGARVRGRKAGLEATIRTHELYWPEFCPVLGIKLDYTTPKGERSSHNPASPSIDRWDNMKGYTQENCFVISFRANSLKSNGTPEELEAVAQYAKEGLW
jgi:hypothetical protein